MQGHLTFAIIGELLALSGTQPIMQQEELEQNILGLERDILAVCPNITVIKNDWSPNFVTFQQVVLRHIPMSMLLNLSLIKDRLGTTGISVMETLYPMISVAWLV